MHTDWIWCCHRGPNACLECRFFLHHSLGLPHFLKSTKRTSFLESAGCSRLPRNAPTRWNFTSRIVSTVANNYDGLLQTFDNIIADTTMDDDMLDCAKGFVEETGGFWVCVHVHVYTYEQIFSETDVVFDIVQQRAMDVLYCKKRIESLLAFVKGEEGQRGLSKLFMPKQQISHQTQEMSPWGKRRLTQLQDPQERYRNLYMAILDNILEQIPRRFSNLESMLFLELVNPGNLRHETSISSRRPSKVSWKVWPSLWFRETEVWTSSPVFRSGLAE